MGYYKATPGFVWRYGKISANSDLTDLDQWISPNTIKTEVPEAPQALKEALEKFINEASERFV